MLDQWLSDLQSTVNSPCVTMSKTEVHNFYSGELAQASQRLHAPVVSACTLSHVFCMVCLALFWSCALLLLLLPWGQKSKAFLLPCGSVTG